MLEVIAGHGRPGCDFCSAYGKRLKKEKKEKRDCRLGRDEYDIHFQEEMYSPEVEKEGKELSGTLLHAVDLRSRCCRPRAHMYTAYHDRLSTSPLQGAPMLPRRWS